MTPDTNELMVTKTLYNEVYDERRKLRTELYYLKEWVRKLEAAFHNTQEVCERLKDAKIQFNERIRNVNNR